METKLKAIAYAKIFPPLGIARVGDSMDPNGHFIAPEWPSERHSADPTFRYKDASGRVKRQAARFRIYAFNRDGSVHSELTCENAEIEWTVSLANHKASWFEFSGAQNALLHFQDPGHEPDPKRNGSFKFRNSKIGRPKAGGKWDRDLRHRRLDVEGGQQQISGRNRGQSPSDLGKYAFTGHFMEKNEVYLGEIRTDMKGRLLVLGGRGKSAGYNEAGDSDPHNWITHYANNDYWHDDTSDGVVTATVTLQDGTKLDAQSARVICAPPDFAPDISNLVTLFDVFQQAAVDHQLKTTELSKLLPDGKTEYWRDIHPILERIQAYSWVSALGLRGHGPGKTGEFLNTEIARQLSEPKSSDGSRQRKAIFAMIRVPAKADATVATDSKDPERTQQANMYFMPPLSGDEGTRTDGDPTTWLTVTRLQYEHFQRWQADDFVTGQKTSGAAICPELREQPALLTRSVLERCVGGAFYPGIEITAIVRLKEFYDGAFRVSPRIRPGDIIQHMACPWQADFFECNTNWWPGQRPDEAVNEFDLDQVRAQFPKERATGELPNLLFPRQSWARGVGNERPDLDAIVKRCVIVPKDGETGDAYFDRELQFLHGEWQKFIFRVPDSGANPWRVQFLLQEDLDRYSDRHVQFRMPSPEEFVAAKASSVADLGRLLSELRARWPEIPLELQLKLGDKNKLLHDYVGYASEAAKKLIAEMLQPLHAAGKSARELFDALSRLTSPSDNRSVEVPEFSQEFARAAFFELCQAIADMNYEKMLETAGDNGMVKHWSSLGFVVQKDVHYNGEETNIVFAETERSIYDGMAYRDYFHILMNIEKYPGFYQYSRCIVDSILKSTQRLIDSPEVAESNIIEKPFDYSPSTFAAKLEEIYEHYRKRGVGEQPWFNDNTRDETIRWRLLRNAQFNQVDGSWLRFIADAGPIDEIHALLFDIWSDETGNGDPSLHHGNLYTALLRSLGVYLPDLESAEYSNSPILREEDFFSPVFQLCISQHAKQYFAEILGMTLYLEWEVLDLVRGIKQLDYLGFDTQFWRMHVGIDNAADGHGAKARRAVDLHLANVLNEGGELAQQNEWKRVWCGFVAFATAGLGYLDSDGDLERRRPKKVSGRLMEVISRKAHYARLQHAQRRLGQDRLNDLFDEPDKLLDALQSSQWIVPGEAAQSRFLSYLTTFQGPMYKVFNRAELDIWVDWINWLGREGDTDWSKSYWNKERSADKLLRHLAQTAAAQMGHVRHKLKGPGHTKPLELASWFQEAVAGGDKKDAYHPLMHALADPHNGFVIPYAPERSNLVVEYLRASRPMGQALDRRFPDLNNQIGRKILVDWIACGCPVNGKVSPGRPRFRPSPVRMSTFVEAYGKGSIH